MTKKTEQKQENNVTSKYKIVEFITKLLKQDDDGLLEKFYDKQVKRINRNIKTLKQNIVASQTNEEVELDKLSDEVEDAEEALTNAYLNIDIEAIKDNASIDMYEAIYWNNIKSKEDKLKALKETINNTITRYGSAEEEMEENIKKYKEKLDLIYKFKK